MIKLKKALINELRRTITDPASRGTARVDTLNGTGTAKTFTLTNYNLMFITSVVADGVTKTLITDYIMDFGDSNTYAKIIFETAPDSDTGNVVITYKSGTNWIYDDQPHVTASMPRVSMLNVGGGQETSGGVSDKVVFRHPTFRIGLWVRTGKEYTIDSYGYTGGKLLDYLVASLEDAIHTIRDDKTIGNLIDIKIAPPVYLGLDEEHNLKRSESTVTTFFKKSYS